MDFFISKVIFETKVQFFCGGSGQCSECTGVYRSVYKTYRSSHQRFPLKEAVLKNFAVFTEIRNLGLRTSNFIKKRLQRFSVKIAKLLRTTILKNIYERRISASGWLCIYHETFLKVIHYFCKKSSIKDVNMLLNLSLPSLVKRVL